MNSELLALLLQTTAADALIHLIRQHELTIATIQLLKERMERLQAAELAEAMRIAQLAYRLSLLMPAPAPSLGRWTLANALLYMDRYHEATQLYQQARAEYLATGYTHEAARMSVGYVFTLAYTGEPERALALAATIEPQLAAASQTDASDLQRLGSLLMNVGVVYEVLGRYEEALAVYDRLTPIAIQLDDQHMLGQVTHNRAYALVQIGALDEALPVYTQAETLFLGVEARVDLARLYTNQASLLARLERYPEAKETQAKAAALLQELEDTDQQRAWLSIFRAWMALESNTPIEEATLAALATTQRAFADHGPIFAEGLTWIMLGRCYLQDQAWAAADAAFAQAQQLAQQSADRTLAYRALHGQGQLAERQAQIQPAIQLYMAAIQQIEAVRQELHVETFRADFLADKLVAYQDLTQLYVRAGQLTAAFQVIERAKSRLLTEKLAFRLGVEAAQLVDVDDEQIRGLTRQLNETLQQLESLYRQAQMAKFHDASVSSEATPDKTGATIAKLEHQVQTLTRTIQRHQPLFSPFATGEPVPLSQIQTHLHDETLLYYYILHGTVWAFVINRLGIQANLELGPLATIEAAHKTLSTAIERMLALVVQFGPERAHRYLPNLLADANRQLHILYQRLFQPLAHYVNGSAPLLITPDGPLHTLPFHALYDGQQYLIEQHAISLTPSASVLDFCMQPAGPATQPILLLGYANPALVSITSELQTIGTLLPQADLWTDAAATTEHFLAHAANYAILHIATHAQFRTDDPMLSSLALADRRLTLAEIARLQLNADLVVLSGCETGRGQLRGGDLLSLAGGFLGAGVRSLLVSLWRVEDNVAALLMGHFYTALRAGQSRTNALRAAQLALLRASGEAGALPKLYAHPAFWAPFTLLGNWLDLPNL